MKSKLLNLIVALVAVVASSASVGAQKRPVEKIEKIDRTEKLERVEKTNVKVARSVGLEEQAIAAEPGVVINLCVESGRITIRGNDQREVRAHFPKETKVEFRRADVADASSPAARIEVMVSESADEDEGVPRFGHCSGSADFELDVPRGATLFLKSETGDFSVDAVAEVHISTNGGKIFMSHITRAVEATSTDGDVSLEDSSGRVRLESFSGSVEAVNVSKVAEGDFFRAKSLSNDVMLDNISHSLVEVSTISGELTMRGPLARGGRYDLRTTSGDVTMTMPADSSFQLLAKVSEGGEIVTEFPLKYSGGVSSMTLLSSGRMVGTYGKGDATINLSSFSGTLRLRRQ
ncbi:MAG: hypothetical protein QOF02_4197 [Blastocatellia bacterium]|jgi:DUF4097 and DUF4098 domain-containing protein YvlB|nr:hypothetical protein [Blastocatellia bacterium]